MGDKQGKELALRLGSSIAEKRKLLSWTQANVAENLGVDTETVSRFERGVSLPSLLTLDRLAQVLKTSVSDLLSESSSQPSDQAEIISGWLSSLGEKDRQYVLEQVKHSCKHLGANK